VLKNLYINISFKKNYVYIDIGARSYSSALEAGSRNNTQNRTKHVKFMQLKLIKLFMKSIEQKKV
jgi:hypothetical protein